MLAKRAPLAAIARSGIVSFMKPVVPSSRIGARRWGGAALSALGLLVIGFLTLRPNPSALSAIPVLCCSATDIGLNVLLFMPLGAGLVLLGLRPGPALVTGILASGAVELTQRWCVPGRFASLNDVASNAAGCLLGILIVAKWGRRARWWPVLAPGIALAVVLAWFLGGYVAQPAIPGPSPWAVEVAHTPPGMAPFLGQVLDVRLQGEPLTKGPVGNLAALRARLSASRKVELTATIVSGDAPKGRSRLLEVVVGAGTVPFLVLDQEGESLLAYQRLGLSWVGLRGPWLVVRSALPRAAGDTIYVRLEATRRDLRLVTAHAGIERETSIRLAPELYFGALFSRLTDGLIWWNLLPAVASFVLLGLALASRSRLLVVAGLASLILSAVGGGCALPAWPVALLASAGALLGRAAANRLRLFGA